MPTRGSGPRAGPGQHPRLFPMLSARSWMAGLCPIGLKTMRQDHCRFVMLGLDPSIAAASDLDRQASVPPAVLGSRPRTTMSGGSCHPDRLILTPMGPRVRPSEKLEVSLDPEQHPKVGRFLEDSRADAGRDSPFGIDLVPQPDIEDRFILPFRRLCAMHDVQHQRGAAGNQL